MKSRHPAVLKTALAMAVSAAALSAHAQYPSEKLEEVIVTGTLSQYSALKSDDAILEIARSISIETEQQIIDKGALTLADALTYSAGVYGRSFGFATRVDSVKVRGLDVPQYQDSLQSLFGNYNNARPDIYTLEQVEVLKGPASVLYGQGSPGGIVNVVSKRPKAEAATEIVAEYGSFDHKELAVDSTGKMTSGGDWLYRMVALYRDADTQVDYVDENTLVLAPSITWRPSEDTDITALVNFRKTESDTAAQFLPVEGTLLPAANGKKIDASTYLGEPDFNQYNTETKSLTLLANQRLSEAWLLEATARYTDGNADYQQAWGDFYGGSERFVYAPDGSLLGDGAVSRTFYRNDQESKQLAADIRIKADFSTGLFDHNVLIGGQYQNIKNTAAGYYLLFQGYPTAANPSGGDGSINVFAPVYGNGLDQAVLDAAYVEGGETEADSAGLYINDQIAFNNWRFTAGLRYDEVKTTTSTDQKQKDDAVSGSAGVLYQFESGIAPYANYSQSFNPVIGTTDGSANGQPLKPEEGEQTEVGIKYQPSQLPLFIAVAYYDIDITNLSDPQAGAGLVQQQSGVANITGFELEANWAITPSLTLELNASQLDSEDPNGERLTAVPESQASSWLGYRAQGGALPGLKAGVGVRYVGEVYGGIFQSTFQPEAIELETPSVTLADMMLGYEVGEWDLSLNVRNIENKKYYAACLGRGDCYPGEERTVVGRVGYNF